MLAILAPLLAAEAGIFRGAWTKYVVPIGAFAMGAFLILDPIVFHGGSFGVEGLQHQVQGLVAIVVAVIEAARARGRLQARGWGLVLPAGLIALGVVFVAHSQHGTMAMRSQLALHRILGATLIMMAIIKGADVMGWVKGNWARIGWLVLGISVALQLFLYAEDTAGHQPPAASHSGH